MSTPKREDNLPGINFCGSPGSDRDSVALGHAAAAELRTMLRIRLEPSLERRTRGRSPEELDRMAATHFRWAKEYWLKASILRQELGLPPAPRRRPSPPSPRRKARAAAAERQTPDLPWPEPLDNLGGVPI